MNQPSNQFGNQAQAGNTNAFASEVKGGEFASQFGGNTNAVSQIFKDGGFSSNNRTKYMIYGLLVVLVLAAAYYLLDDGSGEEEMAATGTEETTTEATDAAPPAEEAKPAEEMAAAPVEQTAPAPVEQAQTAPAEATGAIALAQPADGASRQYDETSGPAEFTWEGQASHIVFSRNASMTPVIMKVPVEGSAYRFHHPYPGKWFWRVETAGGQSDVRSFIVTPPAKRAISLNAPTAPVAGSGGAVTFQGDNKVAFYRLELSNGSFAQPQYRFATSGNTVQLKDVTAGQYQMRLGAFSEVSGRWEYTEPVGVSVQ
jgi:hypothetical protein